MTKEMEVSVAVSDSTVSAISESRASMINLKPVRVGAEEQANLVKRLKANSWCFVSVDDMKIKSSADIPVYTRPYRLPEIKKQKVKNKVVKLIRSGGVARENKLNYGSSIILVPKNNDIRFCVN